MDTNKPQATTERSRQIIGFSLSPAMASEVKQEAAKRGMSLRKLFEEMWSIYSGSPGPQVMKTPASEAELTALATALNSPGSESTQPHDSSAPSRDEIDALRRAINAGEDPLGEALCVLRSPQVRRRLGEVYTPRPIVNAMIGWATEQIPPARVVDPGAGSGRFLLAAARAFPDADLIASETDPLAVRLLQANATALNLGDRLTVFREDYRTLCLPDINGPTLFIGNPPYIRHHEITPEWKNWLAETAAAQGHRASRLAGLHVHFFVKTYELARLGDYGAFITSAEWLDVNYGNVVRMLLTNGLGGTALHVLGPRAMPFGETATTGAITCFKSGGPHRTVRLRSVSTPNRLGKISRKSAAGRSRCCAMLQHRASSAPRASSATAGPVWWWDSMTAASSLSSARYRTAK